MYDFVLYIGSVELVSILNGATEYESESPDELFERIRLSDSDTRGCRGGNGAVEEAYESVVIL